MVEEERQDRKRKISRREFVSGAGAGAAGLMIGGLIGCGGEVPQPAELEIPKSGQLVWDSEKCGACSRCLMACAAYNQGAVAPQLSAIRWMENDYLYGFRFRKPLVCNQCDYPECFFACKVEGAMGFDSETGARYIDAEKCTGCKDCIDACPFDPPRISFDAVNEVAIKCDLCRGRANGPVCVEVCDREALTFVPMEEV
jgi:Fe-S-cluster-containing hydrogenase component 2